jgi:hypothetical protein
VFFLLRACLWIGAIILLVPMLPSMQTGQSPNHAPAPSPGANWAPAATGQPAPTTVALASGTPFADPAAPASAAPAAAPVPGPALPAAVDVVRFCLDNGAVCEAGFSVVAALGDAVGQGLEFAATLQHGETAPAANAAYDPPPIAVATVPVRVSALPAAAVGTLTAADRAEPWLGEAARAAATAAATAATAAGLLVPPLPVPDPRRRPSG